MDDFDLDAIQSSLAESARRLFRGLIDRFVGERIYAFGYWTDPLLTFVAPILNTEEALGRVAAEYHKREPRVQVEDQARMLRWNVGDWEAHRRPDIDLFDPVLERDWDPARRRSEDLHYARDDAAFWAFHHRLADILYGSLATLRDEGLFGPVGIRDGTLIGLFIGDRSDEEAVASAARLNPPSVLEAYRGQMETGHAIGVRWCALARETGPTLEDRTPGGT